MGVVTYFYKNFPGTARTKEHERRVSRQLTYSDLQAFLIGVIHPVTKGNALADKSSLHYATYRSTVNGFSPHREKQRGRAYEDYGQRPCPVPKPQGIPAPFPGLLGPP